MSLASSIATVRESTAAVFKYREIRPPTVKKGKVRPAEFRVGWGSGFCSVADRYVITAFHVLNDGQPRNPADTFLVFVVPGNGDAAYHFPVTAFPVEKPELDLAVLELGACTTAGVHIPALPIAVAPQSDGAAVLTIGFPAPEVAGINIDAQGIYRGGQFFLKSHANEGIVSAQYDVGTTKVYEFNVGWHHGESGGPVVRLDGQVAAFTIMQHYRPVKTPHGTVAGPHRGCSLAAIQAELNLLGATFL